ncbi:MAG: RhuM family protein [Xanthomonadaceae bacterium]|nr:RhuM family protein [Xanthomonadaceae bacterium]
MSATHDLIGHFDDPRLRERLAAEWADASMEGKFGLAPEEHLPALPPLHSAKPRKGDMAACRQQGALQDVRQVESLNVGKTACVKPGDDTHPSEPTHAAAEPAQFPVKELLVACEFGGPIFPAPVPVDGVAKGPTDDVSVPLIGRPAKRIYAGNDPGREAAVRQYLTVQAGSEREVQRKLDLCSLRAIIAVGFKIENGHAAQFRKCAKRIPKDCTIQAWVMRVERLHSGGNGCRFPVESRAA